MLTHDVRRIYVEKRQGFDIEAQGLFHDLKVNLGIHGLECVRVINRYDFSGISDEVYAQSRYTIFAEPPLDLVYDEELPLAPEDKSFVVEYLPGQYDQRADSAAQCIQILTQKERPDVVSAKVIVLRGTVSDQEFKQIKHYCINPVESREAQSAKPQNLEYEAVLPEDVKILTGFISLTPEEIVDTQHELGLAMSTEDLLFCQTYFRDTEHRDPTMTEIRVIDTYWSDHCRHTTFLTQIDHVEIEEGLFTDPLKSAYREYLESRDFVYGENAEIKDVCLMDIAVMGMKELKKLGKLSDLDESDEINACSIVVDVEVNGETEEWLVMFKNETHNHPTEIEPFGGAATCLGGAIRDPLSGRTYVYQAMRVTGSGDPRAKVEDTLPGKLPQRKITTGAAAGYSSYGNQIGLATGQVAEIYDEGFVAKRMEIGAVVGAAPRKNINRQTPVEGDVVILVGGRTGRDGCGGATGSSKEHDLESLTSCGAEVQKGNPPEERKIQRLFREPFVSAMIKKCNDFGAGGVSVAVGELTDSLEIYLDAVSKKYDGLDGTELAISESQERMAVVLAAEDASAFKFFATIENLEATTIACVTADRRLKMFWRNSLIVNISRDFLDTNGIKQKTQVKVNSPSEPQNYFKAPLNTVTRKLPDLKKAWLENLSDLNVCGKKGLVERFDSTIGASTVLMPFGGKYQLTPAEGMAAKIPVLNGETSTATLMAFGYNPLLSTWSPFHGALYAVLEATSKIVAMGGEYSKIRLTLQEYFEKLGQTPEKWGKPFSALLGAFYAQKRLGIPAIGGKDSMSGTFLDLNVPPTLVAFALCTADSRDIVSQEFKKAGSKVVLIRLTRDQYELPDFALAARIFNKITELIRNHHIRSSRSIRLGGLAAAVSEMAFGNRIGMRFSKDMEPSDLFLPAYGSFLLEMEEDTSLKELFDDVPFEVIGSTTDEPQIVLKDIEIPLAEAVSVWTDTLETTFPSQTEIHAKPQPIAHSQRNQHRPSFQLAKPRVIIPIFPGTNCEYDSAKAFEKAGGLTETMVVRNLSALDVEESIVELVSQIRHAQIIMLPGGFSAGDEPDGSGKFIATMFRNPRVKEAVNELLNKRDGLILGICNGFQALIKLGLVPYGEIIDISEDTPTLTFNTIGRHVSCMVQTKVTSTLSPWFSKVELGDIHTIAVSHGEGRFAASAEVVSRLIANGQIATQYVDLAGNPSNDIPYNPNGSIAAVEAITSPDGRVFGKMGHSERTGFQVALNIPGNKYQPIFESGIHYFK